MFMVLLRNVPVAILKSKVAGSFLPRDIWRSNILMRIVSKIDKKKTKSELS